MQGSNKTCRTRITSEFQCPAFFILHSGNAPPLNQPNLGALTFFLLLFITVLLPLPSCSRAIKSENLFPSASSFSSNHLEPKTPRTSALSKYQGLKDLFASGKPPTLARFQKEELMVGQCVMHGHPQTFFEDGMNTFIQNDAALGKMVFAVPTGVGLSSEKLPELSAFDEARAWQQHLKDLRKVNAFSSLQMEYPADKPFVSLARQLGGGSAYVFYSPELTNKLSFRLRTATIHGGKEEVLVSEYFCPHLMGCQFKTSPEKYSHLQPYAYCYYQKAFEFKTPAWSEAPKREIAADPIPETNNGL